MYIKALFFSIRYIFICIYLLYNTMQTCDSRWSILYSERHAISMAQYQKSALRYYKLIHIHAMTTVTKTTTTTTLNPSMLSKRKLESSIHITHIYICSFLLCFDFICLDIFISVIFGVLKVRWFKSESISSTLSIEWTTHTPI